MYLERINSAATGLTARLERQAARCVTCAGTGIDPSQAATPLAMPGFSDYVAAMYPCPTCRARTLERIKGEMRRDVMDLRLPFGG